MTYKFRYKNEGQHKTWYIILIKVFLFLIFILFYFSIEIEYGIALILGVHPVKVIILIYLIPIIFIWYLKVKRLIWVKFPQSLMYFKEFWADSSEFLD